MIGMSIIRMIDERKFSYASLITPSVALSEDKITYFCENSSKPATRDTDVSHLDEESMPHVVSMIDSNS